MSDRIEPDAVDDIVHQWERQWPDLDVSALHIFGRMHRSYLRYQSSLSAVFEKHGINVASFDVLAALRRAGPPYQMTSGQLAEMSLVTTGGVTLRVDRLEQAGLVERERDATDRRVVYARLTAKGKEVFDAAAEEHFENENRMLAGLNAPERKQLADLFRKLEHSIVASETTIDSSASA
ncbi:MAG: MarR family transcriptional regulator [Rhodococcus sp. (in: high G+C Gram-positive bacteria)]|uniref:MarR family winged helix-turn-helix transcriptional regulator n=1 Tax=Rhodococcus sp. TaxID=1831 RepID=UPI002AD732F1|nr:MarR family transcriptional regulator [Rhodococcus sp. (in: high G+C Gram-positive bacteria)]